MIAQIRAKIGDDRLGDLDGCKLDAALSDRMAGERRNSDAADLLAVEQRLDLTVAFHAIGNARPARTLARVEHRTHQGKNAGGLHEDPLRAVRQMLSVQFVQPSFEIIAHQRDRQVGGALDDTDAQPLQGDLELGRTLHVDGLDAHTTLPEISSAISGDRPRLAQQAATAPAEARDAGRT